MSKLPEIHGVNKFAARTNQNFNIKVKPRRYNTSVEDKDYSRTNPANVQRIRSFLTRESNRLGGELENTDDVVALLKGVRQVDKSRSLESVSPKEDNQPDSLKEEGWREELRKAKQLAAQLESSSDDSSMGSEHMDTYLGDRSRFGDGDGSFWDRWVGTVGLWTGEGYQPGKMPSVSSHASGNIAPRAGHKARRQRQAARQRAQTASVAEMVTVNRRSRDVGRRVMTYEERRALTKAKREMKQKKELESSDSDSDAPKRMKRKPEKGVEFSMTDTEKTTVYEGAVDPRNYFGREARADFFEHFKQLDRQKNHYCSLKDFKVAKASLYHPDLSLTDLNIEDVHLPPTGNCSLDMAFSPTNSQSVGSPMAHPGIRRGTSYRQSRRITIVQPDAQAVEEDVDPVLNLIVDEKPNPLITALLKHPEPETDANNSLLALEDGDKPGEYTLGTGRTRVLVGAMKANLPPRANIVLRNTHTTQVNLARQGIGDELGLLFADCLPDLPLVEHVDLTDNRLTDVSLTPIIQALAKRKDILTLNLSQNKGDDVASAALRSYLKQKGCSLISLVLRKTDVDDDECQRLMEALMVNTSLTALDLAQNEIGAREAKNIVNKDFVTGPEAIAASLAMSTCSIKKLDLSWNMIRLKSAVVLGESLASNKNLVELNLAYNSLGKDGGAAIGRSLFSNHALKHLDLSHNSVDPCASFIIAVALRSNKTLERIELNGNPVGRIGGLTLMALSSTLNRKIAVGLKGCNLKFHSPDCWFVPEDPMARTDANGFLHLNLENDYEHAVLMELINLASRNPGLKLSHITYCANDSDSTENIELHLHEAIQRLNSNDEESIEELFREFDMDNSQTISLDEFEDKLHKLGVDDFLSKSEIERIILYADDSHDGQIDKDEFFALIKFLQQEILKKKEVVCYLAREGTQKHWVIPSQGKCKLKISVDPIYREDLEIFSRLHLENVNIMFEDNDQKATLVEYTLENVKLKAEEAHSLWLVLSKEYGSKEKAMAAVIPHMAAPRYARVLLETTLEVQSRGRKRLRQLLGPALLPILGLHTGRYSLELSNPSDRLAFQKIVEMNNFEKKRSQEGGRYDTSQNQDWNNLRNVCYNGARFVMSQAFMSSPPYSGKLEFDYVETTRPGQCEFLKVPHSQVTSDIRFILLLQQLDVIGESLCTQFEEAGSLAGLLSKMDPDTYDLNRTVYAEVAVLYGDPLPNKEEHPKADYLTPYAVSSGMGSEGSNSARSARNKISRKEVTQRRKPLRRSTNSVKKKLNENILASQKRKVRIASAGDIGTSDSKEDARDRPSLTGNGPERRLGGTVIKGVSLCDLPTDEDLLFNTMNALAGRYFTCEQIRFLLLVYPVPKREALSSLAVAAFPRIIDLRNFDQIMEVLSPQCKADILVRLGILNIWNPCKFSGYFEADISRPEERQFMRMVLHLSSYEPGENLHEEKFQWSRLDPVVPGWELPMLWMKEESYPQKGIVSGKYISGGSQYKDAQQSMKLRAAMTDVCVLCELDPKIAEEVMEEGQNSKEILLLQLCPETFELRYDGRLRDDSVEEV